MPIILPDTFYAPVTPLDLLRFKQLANGIIESEPVLGVLLDSVDIDRSESFNPLDLLARKRLIN